MRPVGTPQSFLRYPLSALLSTEAQVRLLRELALTKEARSTSDLSRATGVSRQGVRTALGRMVRTGLVNEDRQGRGRGYRLRRGDPLAPAIVSLFEAERDRFEQLLVELRTALESLEPQPRSAWLANDPVQAELPLRLEVVHDIEHLDGITTELRGKLTALEKRYDLTIECRALSPAEVNISSERPSWLLLGLPPGWQDQQSPALRVREGDPTGEETSSEIARFVAAELGRDPELLDRARAHLRRVLRRGAGISEESLAEWREILDSYSPRRLRALLLSSSERAMRLRRSSPFRPALGPEQRERLRDWLEGKRP